MLAVGIDPLLLDVRRLQQGATDNVALEHADVGLTPELARGVGEGFGPDLALSRGEMRRWTLDFAGCNGLWARWRATGLQGASEPFQLGGLGLSSALHPGILTSSTKIGNCARTKYRLAGPVSGPPSKHYDTPPGNHAR